MGNGEWGTGNGERMRLEMRGEGGAQQEEREKDYGGETVHGISQEAAFSQLFKGEGRLGMGNGEWGMGNGERGMGNGERGMGNRERGTGNREWGTGRGCGSGGQMVNWNVWRRFQI